MVCKISDALRIRYSMALSNSSKGSKEALVWHRRIKINRSRLPEHRGQRVDGGPVGGDDGGDLGEEGSRMKWPFSGYVNNPVNTVSYINLLHEYIRGC